MTQIKQTFFRKVRLLLWTCFTPFSSVSIVDFEQVLFVCFPGCDVVNFEINFFFLVKLFLYMAKKSKQKFKFLENEKSEIYGFHFPSTCYKKVFLWRSFLKKKSYFDKVISKGFVSNTAFWNTVKPFLTSKGSLQIKTLSLNMKIQISTFI